MSRGDETPYCRGNVPVHPEFGQTALRLPTKKLADPPFAGKTRSDPNEAGTVPNAERLV